MQRLLELAHVPPRSHTTMQKPWPTRFQICGLVLTLGNLCTEQSNSRRSMQTLMQCEMHRERAMLTLVQIFLALQTAHNGLQVKIIINMPTSSRMHECTTLAEWCRLRLMRTSSMCFFIASETRKRYTKLSTSSKNTIATAAVDSSHFRRCGISYSSVDGYCCHQYSPASKNSKWCKHHDTYR